MKRIATITEKGRVVGILHGPDFTGQTVRVNGRVWRFDFDRYTGPHWLRKDGEPRKCQCPNKAVWVAFNEWMKKNKL